MAVAVGGPPQRGSINCLGHPIATRFPFSYSFSQSASPTLIGSLRDGALDLLDGVGDVNTARDGGRRTLATPRRRSVNYLYATQSHARMHRHEISFIM